VRVYAYEPVPETAARARWNAAIWAPGAVVENAGLGDRTGTAAFVHYPRLSGASGRYADPDRDASGLAALALAQTVDGRVEPGDADYVRARLGSRWATRTYQCPVTTVSAEVARHGIDRIDLLKIDAEGSELDVLAGIDPADWPRIGQVVLEAHGAELRHGAEAVLREHGFHVSAQRVGFYEHTEIHNVFAVRPHQVRRGHPPRRALVSAAELAEQVRARLAGVGSRVDAVLVLPELPRSATGALDEAALAEGPGDASRATLRHEPPATALEDVIALVWRQLLPDRDMIGRHDDFFDLGGHSLLAIRCTSRLRSLLPAAIPLGLLFEHPTIAGLAGALRAALPAPDTLDRAAALVVQVAAMSDAEVDAALAADAVPERAP
jgi:FkbM family methyltransferase